MTMPTVLIVDDKEENRYYLEILLGGNGYHVVTAQHGEQALELARRSPPDVVVSDLLMPVMDGYTLLRHWKQDTRLAHIPFVVYTATYTEAEDEKLALDLGADAFILKPAEPDAFLKALEDVEARAGVARPQTDSGGPATAEAGLFRQYSTSLVRKLEEKTHELEQANRQLREDIERREGLEERLRRSEERFRLLARATNDAIWDWDITANTRWWGMGFTNLFGYEHGRLRPNEDAWLLLVHPEDRGEVTHCLETGLSGMDESWSAEYRMQRSDGTWSHVEDRRYIIRDGQGRAVRMIGGITDVSERVALEERIRRSQRLEAVGQLTGGVAHDFNNLLTVVLGNADTLAEQLRHEPELRELARIISTAAERGSDLTRRLLAFARKQSLAPRAVDTRALLQDMLPLLRHALGDNIPVSLEIDSTTPLPDAFIDPTQLENAVLNLGVNARDAMPDGGRLTLSLSERQLHEDILEDDMPVSAGHFLCLTVSDTGSGIEAEARQHIFEPFFSTKTEGKGSGLGLAMVHGFLHQSGGHVTLASEPGRGCTFRLYLPVATEGRETTPERTPAPGPDECIPIGHGETILLVEDNPLVRQSVTHLLLSLGYHVIDADNADSAIDLLESDTGIDLLFSDIVMPGPSGLKLADTATRLRPDLPIVLTSGYTERENRVDDEQTRDSQGRYPVLEKPYHRQTLAQYLRAALD
ncbi:MAG: response regulator [Pseudomonadota bacterium]